MKKYILDGKEIKEVATIQEWAEKFDRSNTKVAHDTIGEIGSTIDVSTVFLGIDHSFSAIRDNGDHKPVLFETMVFGGKHDQYQERYCTWDEAVAGHKRVVEMVKPTLWERFVNWFKSPIKRMINNPNKHD
jgi:hypothetical protein